MAEIENRTPRSNNKKFLFIKRNTRIDLTPMVGSWISFNNFFCIYNNNVAACSNEFKYAL